MRVLARVHTKHSPQPANPDEVMVIVFAAELRAVDQPHRHLKPFMEGGSALQLRWGMYQSLNES